MRKQLCFEKIQKGGGVSNYLETIYFRDEYGDNDYPCLLCKHIVEEYLSKGNSVKGKKILDIGSGKGNHLVGFSSMGLESYGIDKRDECVSILDNFIIKECDIESERFPYDDNWFDFVYSKSVLEHVRNTDNFLSESLRVLKPGGIVVFMTPDWSSQYKFFWDDYTHVKAFTRKSLQDAMIINGFKNVNCSYFLQLPIVWKYSWIKYITMLIALLPDSLKWKDKEEKEFRRLIRFSKEKMLLAVGNKVNE